MYLSFYITLRLLKISLYIIHLFYVDLFILFIFFNLFCHKTCDKLIISNCYNNFFFNKPIFFHLICPTFYFIFFFLLEQVEYNIWFCWVKNCFNICIKKKLIIFACMCLCLNVYFSRFITYGSDLDEFVFIMHILVDIVG